MYSAFRGDLLTSCLSLSPLLLVFRLRRLYSQCVNRTTGRHQSLGVAPSFGPDVLFSIRDCSSYWGWVVFSHPDPVVEDSSLYCLWSLRLVENDMTTISRYPFDYKPSAFFASLFLCVLLSLPQTIRLAIVLGNIFACCVPQICVACIWINVTKYFCPHTSRVPV